MKFFDLLAVIYVWPVKKIRPWLLRMLHGSEMPVDRNPTILEIIIISPVAAYVAPWILYQEKLRCRYDWELLIDSQDVEALARIAHRGGRRIKCEKVNWKVEGF